MKILFALIAGCLLAACQSTPVPTAPGKPPIPPDLKIVLERDPCRGACSAYTVTIDSLGQVTLVSKEFIAFPSVSTTVDQGQLERLVAAVEASNFFALQDSYTAHWTNLPSVTTTITINGQSKAIGHYGLGCVPKYDAAPPALCDLEKYIEEATGANRWVQNELTANATPIPTYPYWPQPDAQELRAYEACLVQGGRWEALGLSGLGCNSPTWDQGKSCTDDKDCEGACLGDLEEIEKKNEAVGRSLDSEHLFQQMNARAIVTGTCSAFIANFGCGLRVEEGKLVFMCVD